jgi:hypothetical protein
MASNAGCISGLDMDVFQISPAMIFDHQHNRRLIHRDAFQFLWVERVRPCVVHDPGERVERYFELHSFSRRRHVLRIK